MKRAGILNSDISRVLSYMGHTDTIAGVLIIAVLNNGLNIMNVSSYYQEVIKAVVILVAVLSDRKR